MADDTTLIVISAVSGLTGALLTQIIHVVNGYLTDKRRQNVERGNLYRNKKTEIGENFYYVTGTKMEIIKKNIRHWKNWNACRSESSIAFLQKEITKFNKEMEKLDSDNWKYNLISIYFTVSVTNNEVIAFNDKSHTLYVKVLDLSDRLKKTSENDRDTLYEAYWLTVSDMIYNYEEIYARLEADMNKVKKQLLKEFAY